MPVGWYFIQTVRILVARINSCSLQSFFQVMPWFLFLILHGPILHVGNERKNVL